MRRRKPSGQPSHGGGGVRFAAVGLLLGLIVCGVYAASLGNGFIYDDTQVVLIQRAPDSLGDVGRIFAERHFYNLPYYRPLTRSTLLVQKSLHGEDPLWFHAFNIALGALASILAYALLRLPTFGLPRASAFCAAALFLLHPVASSCVHPVSSGRETLMPVVWMLAMVYAWLRQKHLAAYACFACALLSKESAVVAPLLIAACDLWLRPQEERVRWTRYCGFAVILGGYLLVRQSLFGGAEYAAGSLLPALLSVVYAVQTLIVPFRELHYEPEAAEWISVPHAVTAGAVAVLLGYAAYRRRGPAVYFWCAWLVIMLLPTANLLRQEAHFDERYVWPASLGLFALCATIAVRRRRALAAGAAAAAIFAVISVGRTAKFADDLSFSRQWIRTSPLNVNAHFNLGYALARRDRYAEAAGAYREAVRLRPDYALAQNNLGDALMKAGETAAAEPHLRDAVRLQPDLAEAHYNLGLARAYSGDTREAASFFADAVRLKPDSPEAQMNLANTLAALGRSGEAVAHYHRALSLRPDYEDARRNLHIAEVMLQQRSDSNPRKD